MNPFAIILLLLTAGGVFFAPRRWAVLSFLVGCCYMTVGQGLVIGGLNLPLVRIILIVGIARVILRNDGLAEGLNPLDKLVIAWSAWLFFASLFHFWGSGSGPKYTSGLLLSTTGFYFMIRSLCRESDELEKIICGLCLILFPIAICMLVEQAVHYNIFAVFGGVDEIPTLRNGRYRAQGPFNHAILAGTVGASCLPFALAIWRRHRTISLIGIGSSLLMVGACASSGPILSTLFAITGILLWYQRQFIVIGLKAAVPGYILLSFVMERPPYFLISKIDLTGASSSWHRSYLIQQTIKHLDEWWLLGTDRTIHWMPNQSFISPSHTDITNQYIAYGVGGGLICLILFIVILAWSFRTAWLISGAERFDDGQRFTFWCVGASMFSHATSAISVAYFGQALFFFWLPVAMLGSFYRIARNEQAANPDQNRNSGTDVKPDEPEERNQQIHHGRHMPAFGFRDHPHLQPGRHDRDGCVQRSDTDLPANRSDHRGRWFNR